MWLPDDADTSPVPAVLEYLPYRLNDGTVAGDHQQMTYFAGNGYAGVRVDIRGTGESEGICSPTSTPRRSRLDCLEVIEWIAAQPWCTGAVGMMGYSWSGFNCLQVAALRPPALRAIASCYASDDRYADDVHYRGGLVDPHGHGALVDLHAGLAGAATRSGGGRRPLARPCGWNGSIEAAVDRSIGSLTSAATPREAGVGVGTTTLRDRPAP